MKEIAHPERKIWHGMELVRVSDVVGFGAWLRGQTMPLVEDDPNPYDWAYASDYYRFVEKLPIID